MGGSRFTLLKNQTTNGVGPVMEWVGVSPSTLHLEGNWDGATVTVLGSGDGGETWTAPANSTYTADVITPFNAGRIKVQAKVGGAGALTSLSGYLVPSR